MNYLDDFDKLMRFQQMFSKIGRLYSQIQFDVIKDGLTQIQFKLNGSCISKEFKNMQRNRKFILSNQNKYFKCVNQLLEKKSSALIHAHSQYCQIVSVVVVVAAISGPYICIQFHLSYKNIVCVMIALISSS